MKSEHNVQNEIRNALVGHVYAFRVNVGTGWTGNITRLADGSILIRNPRPFNAGVPPGFHDLFGWKKTEITQDMVGKSIAVFWSMDVKALKGSASDAQKAMARAVINSGGYSGFPKSVDDAKKILKIDD